MNFFQKIKEMAGFGNLELKNPDGLSEEPLTSLLEYFTLLDKTGKKQVKNAFIRYIVDGEDTGYAALVDKDSATALGLSNYMHHPGAKHPFLCRHAALKKLWHGPTATLRRFAEVHQHIFNFSNPHHSTPSSLPGWFDALVRMSVNVSFLGLEEANAKFSALVFDQVLDSESDKKLLVEAFLDYKQWIPLSTGSPFYYRSRQTSASSFADMDKYFAAHVEEIKTFLAAANAEQKIDALQALRASCLDITPLASEIVEIAVGSSKTAREEAYLLVSNSPELVEPVLLDFLKNGSASQRYEAVSLLAKIVQDRAPAILKEHQATEKSEKVKQAIEIALAADSVSSAPVKIDLPDVDVALGVVPLKNREEFLAKLSSVVDSINADNKRRHEHGVKYWEEHGRKYSKPREPYMHDGKRAKAVLDFVEGNAVEARIHLSSDHRKFIDQANIFNPDLEPIHVVRLLCAFGQIHPANHLKHPSMSIWNQDYLDKYRAKCEKPFGLREFNQMVATLPQFGPEPGRVLYAYLYSNSKWSSFCDWEPEAIWPAFIENPKIVMEALTETIVGPNYYGDRKHAAYKVLATFPQLPPQFATVLWEVALGESKSDRPLAQAALQAVPDKGTTVSKTLKDGRQVVRAVAAEWLGRLNDQAAIKPLKESIKKEKSELAKAAMLQALENLGAEIDEFLDREKLLKEAEKGLTKKLPKGMEWVPLENLPTVRWADSGEPVSSDILKWWVVQGIQLKSAECSPLLKRYLGMCKKADAVAFAQYILSSWISHDTATVNPEDAAARAERDADQNWNSSSSYMKDYYRKNYASKELLYQDLFKQYSSELLGTATAQKGMLAIVSAAGDDECAKKCEKYIRKWYGQRLSQCKALVTVLASIESTLALQILLSLANRFRTKGIKDLAREYVDAIADSQGWTLDELADRTVPDGGFARPLDENEEPIEGSEAVLELDFGPRQFLVKLDDRLVPVLTNKEDGKVLKNLPAPGKNDDEEKAKEAKKEFSDAKKIIKEMVKRQTERLYEAMCTQRIWTFRDWKLYLAEHPIVGRLCTRLIWAAREKPDEDGAEGRLLSTLRLLEDGSLTDSSDEAVELKDDDLISLVHSCKLDADIEAAWKKHLEDYDVEPLFNQFDRPVYKLADGKEPQFDVVDFVGHMLTVFKLRTKATKLGFTRGAAEDGGCFYRYHKPFQSLGIQAVIDFSGSMLPEEDGPCALKELSFTALSESGYSWLPAKIDLDSVPAVLLTECYNDLKQIAAEGSGYKENWESSCLF